MVKRLSPDETLEGLVRQLNTAARDAPQPLADSPAEPPARPRSPSGRIEWSLAAPEPDGREWLERLLALARERFASDLLIVSDTPAALRIDGKLERAGGPISSAGAGLLCSAIVPVERRATLAERGSVDFSFELDGLGRFRANVHRERGRWAAAVRLFPSDPPDLEALQLPEQVGRFAELGYGLVLVTGPTGCGKTTTLAALVRRILERRRVHLISIEDPVEYDHGHGTSVVEHVEIGRDARSFADALRSVLRQDPDVLLVGEMRDRESVSIAITAAETGHLVLSTLHTGDGPQTIHRILDSYPAEQMAAVRAQLAASLAGVVSQQLLPRVDGRGRVPAVEVMRMTHGIRNLIRRGKIEQLRSQMSLEPAAGMIDFDQSLARLVRRGLVAVEEARLRAREPAELDQWLGKPNSGKNL
ncbi:MAG TPA: PilT/PilU family type 4a pilus ATPase [Candidatus Polarisedimenticolaceae bacterium]|nr:PilT/PilU family type 4a pilus ATPase [Candidatus Polarisedimenticolaceae bacterium]